MFILTFLTVLGVFFIGLGSAEARVHDARLVSGDTTITMTPGERREVMLTFENTGDYIWQNDGFGHISLYTHGPKYRNSSFDPGKWLSPSQVARIREAAVTPGEVATLRFELHAPENEGEYREVFMLASEDIAWLEGGYVELEITVQSGAEMNVNEEALERAPIQEVSAVSSLSAEMTIAPSTIRARAIKPILQTVQFKNTGTEPWFTYEIHAPEFIQQAAEGSDFTHPAWQGAQVAVVEGAPVGPGELATITFPVMAPEVNGDHEAHFTLYANGQMIDESAFVFPITVTDGKSSPTSRLPRFNEETEVTYLTEEPMIRVGILIVDEETDDEVVITSDTSDFTLTNLAGESLLSLSRGEKVTAWYAGGVYYYSFEGEVKSTPDGLRFVPEQDHAVMTITNFDWRETRGAAQAFNQYRGILELRYNTYKDRIWLINELGMEWYLRGLAEASNTSPGEFQKALATAARSFAYYHLTHGSPRNREFLNLVSTSHDQVYKGYDQEKWGANWVKAVEVSRGQIVTYEEQVALTPYFSQSDGSTRDWFDVWWGDRAYARAVPVPCDAGKALLGHGVGMSARGAMCMAEEGMKWDELLTYFYTGIDIIRFWK